MDCKYAVQVLALQSENATDGDMVNQYSIHSLFLRGQLAVYVRRLY